MSENFREDKNAAELRKREAQPPKREESQRKREAQPPKLEKRPIVRSFHGDDFVDNYEWIRNADVTAHIVAENDWFAERTAHLDPLKKSLVAEFASHTQETDVSVPVRKGDYWYWTRTWEGKSYPGFYRTAAEGTTRPDPDDAAAAGAEACLYDGNVLAQGKDFFSVGVRSVSPDGRLLALGVDYAGNEYFDVRISAIDDDTTVDEMIKRVGYGFAWTADSRRVFYTRMDDAWRTYQVWTHTLGTSAENDELVFQEDDETYYMSIETSRDGKWLIIHSASRTTSEVHLVSLENPRVRFVVSERSADLEYAVEVAGDELLIIHNKDNVNFDLAVAPLAPSTPADWTPLFSPAADERVTEVVAFADFAVVNMRSAGAMQLRAFKRDASAETGWGSGVVLPTEDLSTIYFWGNETYDAREVGFTIESILRPETFQTWSVDTGAIVTLKETPTPNFDATKFVQYRLWATATDGTKLPLTIAHRADLDRTGKNPGYIEGYGSYEVPNDPWFSATALSIMERGVVYIATHVRGGGEMGRQWYEDGKKLKKRNTFTDFIDSARFIVDSGLVDSDRLAANGGSAGGLLMGAITNMAPDLFRVVHANVPFVDALTTILNPELPLTAGEWEEWGNPIADPEVYAYMKSYTPYENIAARQYPAILATTSLNDIRVLYYEPTKWVQALRDTVTNDPIERPIVQRTEMVGGHGGGSGRYKKWEQRAEQLAFIFDQIGVG